MAVTDWRKPHVRARRRITQLVRATCQTIGRYRSYSAAEKATKPNDRVDFLGDVPRGAGGHPFQHRASYVLSRPAVEMVQDVTYTPRGHAWAMGCLEQRLSVRLPSVPEILSGVPLKDAGTLEQAWLVESETPYTYGDWVGDHMRALVEADPNIGPVVLSAELAGKAYVQRDLARLGLTLIAADQPLHLKTAHVLRKQIPSYYWGRPQVDAYRRRLDIDPVAPRKGSLLYLSREGMASEAVDRVYPSARVADIVRELGGKVFDTRQASPETFLDLASSAETVIADQGSAIFGVLQWQTRNLIEITTEDWWHNANLFFAKASGVESYAVLVCDRYRDDQIRPRLMELLDQTGFFGRR